MHNPLYGNPDEMPGRDPFTCESKRPISLVDASVEVFEAIALHRIQLVPELCLSPAEYAYRKARGAGLQLAEIYDFARERNRATRHVYLASRTAH